MTLKILLTSLQALPLRGVATFGMGIRLTASIFFRSFVVDGVAPDSQFLHVEGAGHSDWKKL